MKEPTEDEIEKAFSDTLCHADRDGECVWRHCPQLRDKEPETSRRSCPLWTEKDIYE